VQCGLMLYACGKPQRNFEKSDEQGTIIKLTRLTFERDAVASTGCVRPERSCRGASISTGIGREFVRERWLRVMDEFTFC
jgi:hypothetical protein